MPKDREKTLAAAAIDLGTTRFKIGCVDTSGRLFGIGAMTAPELSGAGLVREIDATVYADRVERLLREYPRELHDVPLGLVCQRSTFLVWDRNTGHALTPVVSWQDRRAVDWCERHRDADEAVVQRTGLLLSPHYAGPKLAAMIGDDKRLAAALAAGDALFGNLDAWLTWRWTDGAAHRSDLTMAARTAMVDIARGDWCDELLDLYGVPRGALPDIVATDAPPLPLTNGMLLCASVADQAAGALAVLDLDRDSALVNLGTGGFVLHPVDDPTLRIPGYLTAPVLATRENPVKCVVEGTINGAGPAVDTFGRARTTWLADDPSPEGFAIPDMDGIGAPHWRPEFGLTLSGAAERLDTRADKRRVVIESLLFRVREILRDVGSGRVPERVYVSGGLARAPSVATGLASLLGRPVELLQQSESTLLGTGRLALGVSPFATPATQRIEPTPDAAYLREKFVRWTDWLHGVLAASE